MTIAEPVSWRYGERYAHFMAEIARSDDTSWVQARAQQKLASYKNFDGWLDGIHKRPAWVTALEKTGPYALGR